MKKCNKKNMKLFIKSLLSRGYKQTTGRLCRIEGNQSYHCCLGVVCRCAIRHGIKIKCDKMIYNTVLFDDEESNLPDKAMEFLDISDSDPLLRIPKHLINKIPSSSEDEEKVRASALNDSYGFSFEEIADCFAFTYLSQPNAQKLFRKVRDDKKRKTKKKTFA